MPLLNYNTNSSTTQPPLPRTKPRESEIQPPLDLRKRPTEQPELPGTGPGQPGLPWTSATTSSQPGLTATGQRVCEIQLPLDLRGYKRPTEQPGLPGTGPEQPGLPRTSATTSSQPGLTATGQRVCEIQPPLDLRSYKRPTEQPGLPGTVPEQPGLPRTSATTSSQSGLTATTNAAARTPTGLIQPRPENEQSSDGFDLEALLLAGGTNGYSATTQRFSEPSEDQSANGFRIASTGLSQVRLENEQTSGGFDLEALLLAGVTNGYSATTQRVSEPSDNQGANHFKFCDLGADRGRRESETEQLGLPGRVREQPQLLSTNKTGTMDRGSEFFINFLGERSGESIGADKSADCRRQGMRGLPSKQGSQGMRGLPV
jgi:hypothetical protein